MSSPDELKAEGNAALKAGNTTKAIELYTQAIDHADAGSHRKEVYHSNRASAYMRLQQFNDALSDAMAATEFNPDYVKGWTLRGTALQFLGRREDAIAAYSQGLRRDADNATIKENLALLSSRSASSAPAPAPAPAAAAAAPTSAPTPAPASGSMSLSPMQYLFTAPSATANTALNALRGMLVMHVVLYLSSGAATVFRRTLILIVVCQVLALGRAHGRPALSKEGAARWAQAVLPDRMAFVLLASVVFLTLAPPMFALLLPLVVVDFFCFGEFVYGLAATLGFGSVLCGLFSKVYPAAADPATTYNTKRYGVYTSLVGWASSMEIMSGIILLLSFKIMPLFVYGQIMKLRYLTSPDSQAAWRKMDGQVRGLTLKPWCPGLVAMLYDRIRGVILWIGAPPAPPSAGGGGGGLMSKCTIM